MLCCWHEVTREGHREIDVGPQNPRRQVRREEIDLRRGRGRLGGNADGVACFSDVGLIQIALFAFLDAMLMSVKQVAELSAVI